MKKITYLFFVLLIVTICGCRDKTILNDTGIVDCVEKSYENGKYWVKVRCLTSGGTVDEFSFKTSHKNYRVGDTIRIR